MKTCITLIGFPLMKRALISAFISLGCLVSAWAGSSVPSSPSVLPVPSLTSVSAIRALSSIEAAKHIPVAFEATVTCFRDDLGILVVQDGPIGVLVKSNTKTRLIPGDRVRIEGTTTSGYRPAVFSSNVTLLRHGAPPKPVPATFNQLTRGRFDSTLVTAHGVVQSVNINAPPTNREAGTTLRVLLDGGYIDVQIDSVDPQKLDPLLDAEIAITGVAGGRFDGKMQLIGIVLRIPSMANIKVIKPAAVSPWALPETPMDEVLGFYHVKNLTSRVRVTGTVTYFEPHATMVLQNGHKSIWIKTDSLANVSIGDHAEATGFPAFSHGFLMLYGSSIRDNGIAAPVTPYPANWQQLASGQHIFDLVTIEGRVVMQAREAAEDEYVLASEGHTFSAIYPHASATGAISPMKDIPVGALIRVTGVCAVDDSSFYGHEVPFRILIRTPDDLAILSRPSWFTVRHLGTVIILLLLGMLAFGARAWFVDRTMRAQVAALGYLGQRRGLILEDINNSRPLPGVLERITELGSATLKGASCWCKLTDGLKLGNFPAETDTAGLRIVEHPIASRSGPALGSVFAAFAARTTPHPDEQKGLASVAELATLAIETARLYSDLVHRSEFDMLTDIKNRFSFEKHLDCLIDEGYRNGGIFGLIYIDLDDFKEVNDRFGHHVGDQYMQQAALRMKRQLRPEDILARLGGDEFGVLVPIAQDRSNVEEIALRLECCFEDPFSAEGHIVNGSASIGIAVYPADGTSGDALLNTADTAMYATKNHRKARARNRKHQPEEELTEESYG